MLYIKAIYTPYIGIQIEIAQLETALAILQQVDVALERSDHQGGGRLPEQANHYHQFCKLFLSKPRQQRSGNTTISAEPLKDF